MFLLSAPASVEGLGLGLARRKGGCLGRNTQSYSEAEGKGLRGPQAQKWDPGGSHMTKQQSAP